MIFLHELSLNSHSPSEHLFTFKLIKNNCLSILVAWLNLFHLQKIFYRFIENYLKNIDPFQK